MKQFARIVQTTQQGLLGTIINVPDDMKVYPSPWPWFATAYIKTDSKKEISYYTMVQFVMLNPSWFPPEVLREYRFVKPGHKKNGTLVRVYGDYSVNKTFYATGLNQPYSKRYFMPLEKSGLPTFI